MSDPIADKVNMLAMLEVQQREEQSILIERHNAIESLREELVGVVLDPVKNQSGRLVVLSLDVKKENIIATLVDAQGGESVVPWSVGRGVKVVMG